MKDDLMIVIRLPIGALAEEVRARHALSEELFDARLEGDGLLLYFRKPSLEEAARSVTYAPIESVLPSNAPSAILQLGKRGGTMARGTRRRRKTVKRNRMKTRGWQVAAKITNSKGQIAVVYRPFVDALFGRNLTPNVERAKFAEILRSNGNEPTDASIDYFLMNTLEYLAQVNKRGEGR